MHQIFGQLNFLHIKLCRSAAINKILMRQNSVHYKTLRCGFCVRLKFVHIGRSCIWLDVISAEAVLGGGCLEEGVAPCSISPSQNMSHDAKGRGQPAPTHYCQMHTSLYGLVVLMGYFVSLVRC